MTDEIKIQEQTPDRRYYTILPNILDELELSPYAIRLYFRLKRRAGEDGVCWENSKHLAEGCHMSIGQISKTKRELEIAGLIKIEKRSLAHGHFPGHLITILDIWPDNVDYFENKSPVHQMNRTCSPGAIGRVHQVVLKNNPSKNREKGRKIDNQGLPPTHSLNPSRENSGFSENNADADNLLKSLKNHQTIQAIKEITRYYPPKTLWERIVTTFPEFDKQRGKDIYEHWIACHYDPKNYDGWLFDWYLNNNYYGNPRNKKRWYDIQHPEDEGEIGENNE